MNTLEDFENLDFRDAESPLKVFGFKMREVMSEDLARPDWITATETEIQLWYVEPVFYENEEAEEYSWRNDIPSPDLAATFFITFEFLQRLRAYYKIEEDISEVKEHFTQYKVCKEYIGD